jgi:hypothetical protein
MRLKVVERGERLADRFRYALIRAVSGFRAPDVVRTLAYRKAFFGEPHAAHTQAAMRGPSAWTVGERELFAAFVSRLNQCLF